MKDENLYILYRTNQRKEVSYVESVKPNKKDGKSQGDWGYTSKADKAVKVSAHHKRRFMADAAYCGFSATAIVVNK